MRTSWSLTLQFRVDKPCAQTQCMLIHRLAPGLRSFETPVVYLNPRQRLSVMIAMGNGILGLASGHFSHIFFTDPYPLAFVRIGGLPPP